MNNTISFVSTGDIRFCDLLDCVTILVIPNALSLALCDYVTYWILRLFGPCPVVVTNSNMPCILLQNNLLQITEVSVKVNQDEFIESHDRYVVMYNKIPKTGSSSMLRMIWSLTVSARLCPWLCVITCSKANSSMN